MLAVRAPAGQTDGKGSSAGGSSEPKALIRSGRSLELSAVYHTYPKALFRLVLQVALSP